ncbi:MAG: hypothetical protein WCG87_01520 [Bacteroidota bacterium]
MKQIVVAILFIIFTGSHSVAQVTDSSIFQFPIQMDEVVVKAAHDGWDVGEFIRRVKSDTTFYKAFRSLHLVSYTSNNDIKVLDDDGKIDDSLFSITQQTRSGNCRSMKVLSEKTSPHFYKRNGDYRYYTAELYAYLFFTKEPVCNEDDIVAGNLYAKGEGVMEKHKCELKQLIFNPGSKIEGVPFIGNKAALFEPDVAKMYDFKLLSVGFDDEDCYLFQAFPKKEYAHDVVYNELSTWFRKSDYAIVARNYSLSYHTLFFDFDVTMKVRLRNVNGKLLPSVIHYNGNWHAITKGRERVRFNTTITY